MDKDKSPFLEEEDVFSLLNDSNSSFDYGLLYLGSGFDHSGSGSTNEASLGNGTMGSVATKASQSQALLPPASFEANNILNSLDIHQEKVMATKSSESPGLVFPPVSLDANDLLNSFDMQQDNFMATQSSKSPGLFPPVSLEAGNSMISTNFTVPSSQQAPRPGRKIMNGEELARIASFEPKRARRILTNRSAAVRSKEKKKLEVNNLEQQWQELRSTLTQRNTVLSKKQEDNKNLVAENIYLREQIDMAAQQISSLDSQIEEVISDIEKAKLHPGPILPNDGAGTNPLVLNNNAPSPMLGTYKPQNLQCPNGNNNAPQPMPAIHHHQLGPIVPNGGVGTNSLLNNNAPLPMPTPQQYPPNLQVPPQNQFQLQPCGVGFQQPFSWPNNFGGQPSFQNPQTFLNQAQNKQGRGAMSLPFEPQQPLMFYDQLSIDHGDFSTDDIYFLPSLLGQNDSNI